MKSAEKFLATLSILLLSAATALQCSAASDLALPETGGIGTTIFLVGGGALMLFAVVFLIIKKTRGE